MTQLEEKAVAPWADIVARRVVRGLTNVEVCELARKASDCEHDARAHERELAALKEDVAETKKCIEMKLGEARDYLQMVDRGTLEETVECGVLNDVAANRVGYVRLDTGEVVEVRAMERAQMSIADAIAPAPTAEQVALLDAYEHEHGRFAHRGIEEDEEE